MRVVTLIELGGNYRVRTYHQFITTVIAILTHSLFPLDVTVFGLPMGNHLILKQITSIEVTSDHFINHVLMITESLS